MAHLPSLGVIVVRHSTTGKGRWSTISSPTLDRLKLRSTVSYSIVWWIQAAQASYSGKAQHQKTGRCATISIPTLGRLRLHIIVSYSIVWWIQAAQASYSGEAQHQKKVRCATIGIPT